MNEELPSSAILSFIDSSGAFTYMPKHVKNSTIIWGDNAIGGRKAATQLITKKIAKIAISSHTIKDLLLIGYQMISNLKIATSYF